MRARVYITCSWNEAYQAPYSCANIKKIQIYFWGLLFWTSTVGHERRCRAKLRNYFDHLMFFNVHATHGTRAFLHSGPVGAWSPWPVSNPHPRAQPRNATATEQPPRPRREGVNISFNFIYCTLRTRRHYTRGPYIQFTHTIPPCNLLFTVQTRTKVSSRIGYYYFLVFTFHWSARVDSQLFPLWPVLPIGSLKQWQCQDLSRNEQCARFPL